MTRTVAACLVLAAALSGEAAAQQQVRVMLPAYRESVIMDTLRQDHQIRSAPDAVYRAVLDAYRELEIPTGNTDGKVGIVGSERFEKRIKLGPTQLSQLFSCGDGPAGAHADFYRLTIAIVSWVKPREGGESTLGIAVAASGQDITGVYKAPRECASTGRIEQKIKDKVELLARR
jgi:hypothetical protein